MGNTLHDHARQSFPQRILSAAEVAVVASLCVDVEVSSPLPVRVCDPHIGSTFELQLFKLCQDSAKKSWLFIANEKAVLSTSFDEGSVFGGHPLPWRNWCDHCYGSPECAKGIYSGLSRDHSST